MGSYEDMKRQQEIYQDQLLIPSQRQLCTLRTGVRMQSTVAKTRGSGNTSKVQIPAVLLPGCVTCPPLLNLSRPVSTFVERRHSQDLPHGVVQGIKQNNHGMCLAHIKCCCHFFSKIYIYISTYLDKKYTLLILDQILRSG